MISSPDRTVGPLFASNERLWLRIWATMQAAALVAGCYVSLVGVRGWPPTPGTRNPLLPIAISALLIGYHVAGVGAYAWMMRRPWSVYVFVPLGWAMIISAMAVSPIFGLLILGAILQGFIFLPFASAIAALAIVILAMAASMIAQGAVGTALTVARVVGVLAMGTTFGAVMLYIHRANRDSAVRTHLLQQLDDAHRDLAARAKEAGIQEERQRLARDIHDTLAQGFTSVIQHLEAIELTVAAPRMRAEDALERALPHLANAQAVSRVSLEEIRRLLWALRPPQLVEATLASAIERFVAQWSERNGIATECKAGSLPALRADADVLFLRATQESLSNVARHANAAHVAVSIDCVDGLVLLSVEDDGCGCTDADVSASGKMGIVGMRERVRPFGGRVLLESAGAGGTSLTVAVPLAAIAAAPA